MNAMQRMDNFQTIEYNDLKRRIMANPIADQNREKTLDVLRKLLNKAGSSPDIFLFGMRQFADQLDAELEKQNALPSETTYDHNSEVWVIN